MEQQFTLDTPDGFKLYGLVNSPRGKANDKAIIHVHGLTGWQGDHAAVVMAQYMPKHGYDVIRINLYHWNEKARSLVDCTLADHARDINLAVRHFSKKYKKLFATGHSYGGPSLMCSNINAFSAVSLWDPSYALGEVWNRKSFSRAGKYYFDPNGHGLVIGKDFLEEALSFDKTRARKLSAKCKIPLQIIFCDRNSVWVHHKESFHTYAKGPTDEKITKKSQHSFYEEGASAWLMRQTRQWFDRF